MLVHRITAAIIWALSGLHVEVRHFLFYSAFPAVGCTAGTIPLLGGLIIVIVEIA